MKICFISPKAYMLFNENVQSTFGGAEVQLFLIAKELVKNENYDISFMVGDYGQPAVEEYYNIHLYKALDQQKNIFSQLWTFYKCFRFFRMVCINK